MSIYAVSLLLILLWLLIIPFCSGLFLVKTMPQGARNKIMAVLCGYLVMVALFQITYTVFVLWHNDFTHLVIVYTVIISAYALVSLIICRNDAKALFGGQAKKHERGYLLLMGAVFLLVAFQIFMSLYYQFSDGDDAYYAAASVVTEGSNRMFVIDPYTGQATAFDARHALSASSVWVAFLARITNIHPMVMSHLILPVFLIPLTYGIYLQIAKMLFADKKAGVPIFMIILNLLFIFGNATIFTGATFFLTRTWQGKSMLANQMIPVVYLVLFLLWQESKKAGSWLLLAAVMVASVCASTMGVYLIPMLAGAGILLLIGNKKELHMIFRFAACCIPSFIYGIIYLVLK